MKPSSALLIILMLIVSAPAQACLTRILKTPADIEKLLSENGSQSSYQQKVIIEEFKRDKSYYDALVVDFCTLKMMGDADKRRNEMNLKIMDMLIEKWNPKGVTDEKNNP